MYNLAKIETDFPWALEDRSLDRPREKTGFNSFENLPQGWGNIIKEHLIQLEKILTDFNIIDTFSVIQIKKKYGALRFYYSFESPHFSDNNENESNLIPKEAKRAVSQCIEDLEEATYKTCCYCGEAKDSVTYRSDHMHYSCDDCEKVYARN